MNLELLDPFQESQVPDRVDATLQLPAEIVELERTSSRSRKQQHKDDVEDWKAAYHVAYNRRGVYVAVGYGSGIVAVYSTLSRSLVALYPPIITKKDKQAAADEVIGTKQEKGQQQQQQEVNNNNGCSSVSWSRRSRTLLAGAAGDTTVRLYDTTHPFGPEEGSPHVIELIQQPGSTDGDNNTASPSSPKKKTTGTTSSATAHHPDHDEILPTHSFDETTHNISSSFKGSADRRYVFVKTCRNVSTRLLGPGDVVPPRVTTTPPKSSTNDDDDDDDAEAPAKKKKYPCVYFDFACPVGGSLQINPKRPTCGLAVLSDESLVLFAVPEAAFVEKGDEDDDDVKVHLVTLYDTSITCAAFDPHGDRIYAATKDGVWMGFDVSDVWQALDDEHYQAPPSAASGGVTTTIPNHCSTPKFTIPVSPAMVWHVLVSRNGKFVILNSADGAIRLYSAQDCWEKKPDEERRSAPIYVFQDVVTKVKFASCDLSGDGEHVVGGASGADDDKYELYMWNTSTGALMDKLTGASSKLYSVAWHPTRSFLAVSCADGLVDIWGPRINWTAFAPDFQALPMNVEYIEREDEFDVDENGRHLATDHDDQNKSGENEKNAIVDVTTIEPVPVFASDSEDEEEVFEFETRVKNLIIGRGKVTNKSAAGDD